MLPHADIHGRKPFRSMTKFNIPEYRVGTDCLRVGVFIRLEGLKWFEHPFLFKNFKLSSEDQIRTLQSMGVKEVTCVPGESDVLPYNEPPNQFHDTDERKAKAAADNLWRIKNEAAEQLKKRKEQIAERERKYVTSQENVSTIIKGISSGNTVKVKDAVTFADEFSQYFLKDRTSTLQLMQMAAKKDEGLYYHAMNVTVLSMILGKQLGVFSEEMRCLCLGALFHDIGKSKIDIKVLYKDEKKMTKPERDFLRLHPKYGVEILSATPEMPKAVLLTVFQHHERLDGSGWPKGVSGDQIHHLSRIIAIADVYDNLCNKRNPADSLTPYEALSQMFVVHKSALDQRMLAAFIRCLGIYPPGTVVLLNNGLVGMVISVDPENQLQPSIVVYDADIPKSEAVIVDMKNEPDLKIVKSLRPASLLREIYEYLSPRERVTYFVDSEKPPADAKEG
jgi:putative nucleotidyltransferase with HDIG domain